MALKNKLFLYLLIFGMSQTAISQISSEAWQNYDNSTYKELNIENEGDATIIFDRTYYEAKGIKNDKVSLQVTVHRKIKINSLYGLEQFNKLYIPTVNDLNYNIKFVDCRAKTLKKGKSEVQTDTSLFVTTTLPANTPFYYKLKGSVKMLAITDIEIGDEIEYIYSVNHIYEIAPEYFYKADRMAFSSGNFCMEKSCFFESKRFETTIWPYNFHNGATRETNFDYKNGKKISLTNIKKDSDHMYTNRNIDQPFLQYMLTYRDPVEKSYTWETFAKLFKPRRSETKHNYIFDGEKMYETLRSVGKLKSTKEKFESLLEKINKPLEDNFSTYNSVENDVYTAWSYAKILSKTAKGLRLPINFHFVVSKNYGTLDKSYVSISQFDNIIVSFTDDSGQKQYMPLLEPYSKLNEIKLEFQGTECYIISQDGNGKRSFSFDKIPTSGNPNDYNKNVNVVLHKFESDTITYKIKEQLKYKGDAWITIKPIVSAVINDTTNREKNLKVFIKNHIVSSNLLDSVYDVDYAVIADSFIISYSYEIQQKIIKNSDIVNLQVKMFIENEFYTPYHLRNKREFPGYLIEEPNVHYTLNIDMGNKFSWMENNLITNKFENLIGSISSGYENDNNSLKLYFNLTYAKHSFKAQEWKDMLNIRDKGYNFLTSNLYFKNK